MQTKLFVGLTFHEDNSFARKIQSFRGRFDEKVATNPSVHMPLVAPFEVEQVELAGLEQEITEELESFFYGHGGNLSVRFTGVDVYTHGGRSLLHLNPEQQADFLHCEEALVQVCKDHIGNRDKRPRGDKKFLTIGRFVEPTSLHAAMEVASREFQDCTELPVKGVCLFRKHQGVWYQQAALHLFEANP